MKDPTKSACCDDCTEAKVTPTAPKPTVRVLTTKGYTTTTVLDATILRTAPPEGLDAVLRAGGVEPVTLEPRAAAAVALDDARYTALAETLLGRLAYDPTTKQWAPTVRVPEVTVVGPGISTRPLYEALHEAHLDPMRWLLMGGAYAGSTR